MYDVKILKNLVYSEYDREVLAADVYLPVGKKDIPCMILLHGGSWKLGNTEAYAEWGKALAAQGICAMSINYRLTFIHYPSWPGVLDDVENAVKFLVRRAHEWDLDPYNMGYMGDSSGAHLAFMATVRHEYTSHRIRAIVGAYGVYDLGAWGEYAAKKWSYQSNVVTNFIGKDLWDVNAYRAVSPLYTLERSLLDNPLINPEVMLLWGEQDCYVPCASQSVPFARMLKKTRLKVETIAVPDAAHLWFPRDIMAGEINEMDEYPLNEVAPRVMAFLKRVLEKPRFKARTDAVGDYANCPGFRISRFKDGDPLKEQYGPDVDRLEA